MMEVAMESLVWDQAASSSDDVWRQELALQFRRRQWRDGRDGREAVKLFKSHHNRFKQLASDLRQTA